MAERVQNCKIKKKNQITSNLEMFTLNQSSWKFEYFEIFLEYFENLNTMLLQYVLHLGWHGVLLNDLKLILMFRSTISFLKLLLP